MVNDGQHHDGDAATMGVALECGGTVKAVEAGHHDIEDDDIGLFGPRHLQTFHTVCGLQGVVARFLQKLGDHFSNGRIVIDHQHRLGAVCSLL